MKKVFIITAVAFILFAAEFIFAEIFGRWFKPNLLILLIIFVDLHLGVRYGLFVAILAGLLKDSFGVGIFGIHISSFVLCVYLTTLIRRHIFYSMEFGFLRVLMAFLIVAVNNALNYIFISFFHTIDVGEVVFFVMLPEIFATTLLAPAIFRTLKKCVLSLSV